MSSILIEGIRGPVNEDKLIIHFQKQKNNGGDILSVIYPLSINQQNAAVINFENEKTADNVLKKKQVFNGSKLKVTKEYQIFQQCSATFNIKLLENCFSTSNLNEIVRSVKLLLPNIHVLNSKLGLIVSGSWHEIEKSRNLIQSKIKSSEEIFNVKKNAEEIPAKNLQRLQKDEKNESINEELFLEASEELTEETEKKVLKKPKDVADSKPVSKPRKLDVKTLIKELEPFVLDANVMGYILKFYKQQVEVIEKLNNVRFHFDEVGDEFFVKCLQNETKTPPRLLNAKKQLICAFDSIKNLDIYRLESFTIKQLFGGVKILEVAFKAAAEIVSQFHPKVFIRINGYDLENKVHFVTTSNTSLMNVARKWFISTVTRFNKQNPVFLDSSLYGYIKKTRSENLNKLKTITSSQLIEVTSKDKTAIVFDSKVNNINFNKDVLEPFLTFIKIIQTNSSQIKVIVPPISLPKINLVIQEFLSSSNYPNVHLYQSKECLSLIILTSEYLNELNQANLFFVKRLKLETEK